MLKTSPVSLAIAIAQRGRGAKCAKIFADCGIMVQYIGLGHGTANSEIMDMLGLDGPEKDVILGLTLCGNVSEAFDRLGAEMGFGNSGTGIGFSMPVSSVNEGAAERIELPKEYERSCCEVQEHFEMIVTVLDGGMTEIVMDSAKEAGARGGTVMKCRDMSPDSARKVFGVTIHQDKEILMLVVPRKNKDSIMKAICTTVLHEIGEHATAFSMAIDDVVGLHV